MSQDQESGARAVEYGLETARKIATVLRGKKVGNARSNEFEVDGREIVIKCARFTTDSVGVPYQMLERVVAVLGSFEIESGEYDLYEMTTLDFRKFMRPTRSTGPSAGRVGIVRRSAFLTHGRFVRRITLT